MYLLTGKSSCEGGYTFTPAKVTVTIVGNNKITKYNGYEQSVEGYKITDISNELYEDEN